MDASMVPESWREALAPALADPRCRELGAFLDAEESAGKRVFPSRANWLRALELTPLNDVKVVILGQDPYHGSGQAHGLAFSVPRDVHIPPSLVNVYKELESDLGVPRAAHGNLEAWAGQGVLLLNNSLTVEEGRAGSHQNRGWEPITDAILAAVARSERPSVFMLWGKHAQAKATQVPELSAGRHLVLTAPHPSPLSARTGFFGCRHFSQANQFLEQHGRGRIDWRV